MKQESTPARQWPEPYISIGDYARAATREQLHSVCLALEFNYRKLPTGAWIYEGLAPDYPAPKDKWEKWSPENHSAPDWWRVLDVESQQVSLVHFEAVDPVETSLGRLWKRAVANGHPIVYCREGLEGPAAIVTPDPGIPGVREEDMDLLFTHIDAAPWPSVFETLDPKDATAFTKVFGGYFLPGNYYFNQFMMMLLGASPMVPGLPKCRPTATMLVKQQKFGFGPQK